MDRLDEGVYWCARDLKSSPIGNHHFILLVLPETSRLFSNVPSTQEDTPDGVIYFYTIGAFKTDDILPNLLKVSINQEADVKAVREYVDPEEHTSLFTPDFDLESHQVRSPSGSSNKNFVEKIIQLTNNFQGKGNIQYSLIDENCAAWVNTLFKVAGVDKDSREIAGEFFGVDWGEEDLIPESFFVD